MKSCNGCKYADWQRTANGRLHPNGEGVCTAIVVLPRLPVAMYWPGKHDPKPYGGTISRRLEHETHCPYFVRDQA